MDIPELTDGVIRLRPFTRDDVDAHLAGDDEEQINWLNSGHPSTRQSVTDWIARNQHSWEHGGPVYNFGIFEIETATLVGMVEANADSQQLRGVNQGEANISYSLYPAGRGRGLASRAVGLVMRFLAANGFSAGIIRAEEANIRSVAVARRCGFEATGEVLAGENNGPTELIVFRKATTQPT